jgi:hypothetical protein
MNAQTEVLISTFPIRRPFMIGPCQESKSSPYALQEERGVQLLSDSSPHVLASRPRFLFHLEPGFDWLSPRSARGLGQKLELRLSCLARKLSTGSSRARALAPSRLTARPGRRRVEDAFKTYHESAVMRIFCQ